MNQKHTVLYLNGKGRTSQVIRDNLVAIFGEAAIGYRTIMSNLRQANISPGNTTR
jgi:hypothetical protein